MVYDVSDFDKLCCWLGDSERLAPWSNCCSVSKIGIFAEKALRIIYQIVYDMPYESECAHAGPLLGYNPFLSEDTNWGKDFFARLRNRTAVYMTFFPSDETQILFPNFDDTLPILYHGLELTNADLLFTLPWLNINNIRGAFKKFCNSTIKRNGNVTNYTLFYNIITTEFNAFATFF